MRKAFGSFYRPGQAQMDGMWRQGLFALDASFLLNLYRYSEQTRADVLATLAKLKNQLWLPHQAGLEFHSNRPAVMLDHARKFTTMRAEFESARKRVESLYRDPSQDATDAGSLQEAWERLDSYLEEHERRSIQPTMSTDDDPVLAAVTDLLDGRVGDPFEDERLKEIYAAGAERTQIDSRPDSKTSLSLNRIVTETWSYGTRWSSRRRLRGKRSSSLPRMKSEIGGGSTRAGPSDRCRH